MTRYILPVLLAFLWPCFALAQQVLPPSSASALVCAFNTSPPAITTGNFAYVQCDANGKLLTTLPIGTPGFATGVSMWYPTSPATIGTGAATVANVVSCSVMNVPSGGVTIKQISISSTANTAATQGSIAIFNANGTSNRPGTLIDTVVTWTFSGASAVFAGVMTNTTDTLQGGSYWVCTYSNSTPTYQSIALAGGEIQPSLIGSTNVAQILTPGAVITGLSCTAGTNCGSTTAWSGSTPAWGSLVGATWTNNTTAITPATAIQIN